jgi:hypothetical protein
MKKQLLLACILLSACAPSKEQKSDCINILKQQYPNIETECQDTLKSAKGFDGISGGEWTYKVVGTKAHPVVAYGYFGHKRAPAYLWDWVKFLPTCVIGVVVIPGWHAWSCYSWDVDLPNKSVKVHQGGLEF